MKNFPKITRITDDLALETYAQAYQRVSRSAVPIAYLKQADVYAVKVNKKIIGGFVLANGPQFRTIALFMQEEDQEQFYEQTNPSNQCTELTCYWMSRNAQNKILLNLYVWLSLAVILKLKCKAFILFGTSSKSLARLYSQTPRAILIHQGRIKRRNAFIFVGKRKECFRGILEVVASKLRRLVYIRLYHNPSKAIPKLQQVESHSISKLFQ